MRTWIANCWLSFSTGILFVPRPFFVAGIVVGTLGPELDHTWGGSAPTSLQKTPTTAGLTLVALCGVMLTSMGVVFSTTCVALSITSTQLGPRQLREFPSQQVAQVTSVCRLILLQGGRLVRWRLPVLRMFLGPPSMTSSGDTA